MKHLARILALVLGMGSPAWAEMPDPSSFNWLLARYVAEGETNGVRLHQVDYLAWSADPEYPKALATLGAFDPGRLETDEERLAFWINAYNLLAIKVVIDHQVEGSIKDAGSLFHPVWKMDAGSVGGKVVTLDFIEHQILRPLREPRIHMAVVCASVGCPDLRKEAYDPERLDGQLDDQARRYLANPERGVRGTGNVTISAIFDWFEDDFGGKDGVLRFIETYLPKGTAPPVAVDGYLKYDWSLNGR